MIEGESEHITSADGIRGSEANAAISRQADRSEASAGGADSIMDFIDRFMVG